MPEPVFTPLLLRLADPPTQKDAVVVLVVPADGVPLQATATLKLSKSAYQSPLVQFVVKRKIIYCPAQLAMT